MVEGREGSFDMMQVESKSLYSTLPNITCKESV